MAEIQHVDFYKSCLLQFKINDVWHTWIDYEKFHELMADYYVEKSTFNSQVR